MEEHDASSVIAGSKATKQSIFRVEDGLLRCARNDRAMVSAALFRSAKAAGITADGLR
jgi:hypothetical protein